jgi:hypothetical protein
LRFEPLEARETPATFIYLMPGYSSPVGNNGMSVLANYLDNDPAMDAHIMVIDWTWNQGIINLPLTPAVQTQVASTRIRDDLRDNNATTADKVIFVGHSYGGYLAYSLANNVPGLDRPVDSLVLIDPIDWRFTHRWWPRFSQVGLKNPLPNGVEGSDVLNILQRSPFQGWFKAPLRGFAVDGAINDIVIGKGADDRWGSYDDATHYNIDSDFGRDGKKLGVYETVQSFLHDKVLGIPSPIFATQSQAAPAALWAELQAQFPFITDAQLYQDDPQPDTMPEMYHDQGRAVSFKLATSTRGITVDPLPTTPVGPTLEVTGKVDGWGEAALGKALFRTLKAYAAELGVDRIQWNGKIWSDEYANDIGYIGFYPKDRFFVGFSLNGSQQVDPDAHARFMAALRTAWAEEVQLHAGWPLIAVRSQYVYQNPWVMQARIMPESDLNAPDRIGRFSITVNLVDVNNKPKTRFNIEILPARDRAQADASYPEGKKLWSLPWYLTMPTWRYRGFVIRA